MALLSQVSTSYPRVPRDFFARTRAYFLSYYPDTDSFLAYTGKVTAEYIFRNPANYAVTATLVFPFGNLPHYGEYIYDRATGRPVDVSDTLKYGVRLDGNPVEATVRHTLKARHTTFSLDEDLPKLADSYISDSFLQRSSVLCTTWATLCPRPG